MRKAPKTPEVPADWVPFGWQGISLRVPADWSPAALTGLADEGYLRIDGPEQPRVEIKWARSKGFVNVEKTVDKYLQTITKGRKGSKVKVSTGAKVPIRMPKDRSSLQGFRWRAEQDAIGVAWLCKTCGRTMLIQVLGPTDSDVEGLASQILTSFQCHPDGGWAQWALYGFSCMVPGKFQLAGQRLLTGLLEMSFENGRTRLRVARWGLANVALKNTALRTWLNEKNAKSWRTYRVILEDAKIHGHEGLAISGPSAVPWVHAAAIIMRTFGRNYPDVMRGAAWVCEPGNKIYHVEGVIDPADEEEVAEVIDSIRCHEEEEEEDA